MSLGVEHQEELSSGKFASVLKTFLFIEIFVCLGALPQLASCIECNAVNVCDAHHVQAEFDDVLARAIGLAHRVHVPRP